MLFPCFEILLSNLGALLTKLNEFYISGIKNTRYTCETFGSKMDQNLKKLPTRFGT